MPRQLAIISTGRRGRPQQYRPKMCDLIDNYQFNRGATITEICELLGLPYRVVYDWMDRYPEFSQAIARARARCDDHVVKGLYNRCVGLDIREQRVTKDGDVVDISRELPPDPDAAIAWLANRQPEEWRRKDRDDVSQVNIQINLVGTTTPDK